MNELKIAVTSDVELSLLAAVIFTFDEVINDERLQLLPEREVEISINAQIDPKESANVTISLGRHKSNRWTSRYRIADLPKNSSGLSNLKSLAFKAVNQLFALGGEGFSSSDYFIRAV